MTVLVAGATGTTGTAVLARLLATGTSVRAMTRSPDKASALRDTGVDAVVAAFDDPAALRAAFDGVDAAYVATPSSPAMAATEAGLAAAAGAAGAHLVKLSTLGAAPDSPLRLGRMHAESESAIEAAGGSWTFLQPNGFMQNDLAWAGQVPSGSIAGPVMDAAWSIVDVRDVADVAAAALTDPDSYRGRRITVTGPQARTPRDRVAALATILGRELTVIDVPVGAVLDQLRGYGVSQWEAEGLGELFELYAQGLATGVAPDAETWLGHQARTWETFATDHAHHFTG